MIRDILKEVLNIKEAKEISKDTFMYFFLDEIKDIDNINDIEDLGEKDNIEINLVTDKTYKEDDPGNGEWYKIKTEDIIKYIETTVDKFESGDYLDFSGYPLEQCVAKYIESKFEAKWFPDWDSFAKTMEGNSTDLNKV